MMDVNSAKAPQLLRDVNTQNTDQDPKTQIINTMFSMYEDNKSYEELLQFAKKNISNLAYHTNIIDRGISYFTNVTPTKSIQGAIILLTIKKNGYTNTEQIQEFDIKLTVEDLVEIKYYDSKGVCIYNSSCSQDDNHKCQIIAAVADNSSSKDFICNFLDGMYLVQTRLPKPRDIANSPAQLGDMNVELDVIKATDTPVKSGNTYVELNINLGVVPVKDPNIEAKSVSNISLADTHGNTLLVIHQLIQTGVLKIKDKEEYNKLQAILLNSMKSNAQYVENFPRILEAALIHNPKSIAKVTFLGNILNGYVGNDFFTLDLLQHLANSRVDYKILWSDNDGEFVRQFLWNLYIKSFDKHGAEYRTVPDSFRGGNSKVSCNKTLNDHHELRGRFLRNMNNYIDHLIVYEFFRPINLLRSHARVRLNILNDIAKNAGVKGAVYCPTYYNVEAINNWFRNYVLKDIITFSEYYSSKLIFTFSGYTLYTAIRYNGGGGDVPPKDVAIVEHGHEYSKHVNTGYDLGSVTDNGKFVSLYDSFGNNKGGLALIGTRKVGILYQTV